MCKKDLQTTGMGVHYLDRHLEGLGAERDVIVLTTNPQNYEIMFFRDGSLRFCWLFPSISERHKEGNNFS